MYTLYIIYTRAKKKEGKREEGEGEEDGRRKGEGRRGKTGEGEGKRGCDKIAPYRTEG